MSKELKIEVMILTLKVADMSLGVGQWLMISVSICQQLGAVVSTSAIPKLRPSGMGTRDWMSGIGGN